MIGWSYLALVHTVAHSKNSSSIRNVVPTIIFQKPESNGNILTDLSMFSLAESCFLCIRTILDGWRGLGNSFFNQVWLIQYTSSVRIKAFSFKRLHGIFPPAALS